MNKTVDDQARGPFLTPAPSTSESRSSSLFHTGADKTRPLGSPPPFCPAPSADVVRPRVPRPHGLAQAQRPLRPRSGRALRRRLLRPPGASLPPLYFLYLSLAPSRFLSPPSSCPPVTPRLRHVRRQRISARTTSSDNAPSRAALFLPTHPYPPRSCASGGGPRAHPPATRASRTTSKKRRSGPPPLQSAPLTPEPMPPKAPLQTAPRPFSPSSLHLSVRAGSLLLPPLLPLRMPTSTRPQ